MTGVFLNALPGPSTRQVFTSGTGATYTTPAGVRRILVRMVGAGGGGAGGGGGGTQVGGAAGSAGSSDTSSYLIGENTYL